MDTNVKEFLVGYLKDVKGFGTLEAMVLLSSHKEESTIPLWEEVVEELSNVTLGDNEYGNECLKVVMELEDVILGY